jgi:release factor glutamine methyltransferase
VTLTVQAALRTAVSILDTAAIPDPARDARRLMAASLGVGADRITLLLRDNLTADQARAFDKMIARRALGEPVSHLVGGRLFLDRWFTVTRDVLDPRPETEVLVLEALQKPFADVLDLGTGSGAILLSLLAERTDATGLGVDLSDAALTVARRNAHDLGVASRARLVRSDWFAQVDGTFDLIVSNPPYIARDEMPGLDRDVRDHEPRIALTDESDGLEAYRRIAAGAAAHLRPRGWVMVEIGPTQALAVRDLLAGGGFDRIGARQDFDGRDRVIFGQKPQKMA